MPNYNDFEPNYSYTPVDGESPFRFWCQKVLPAVYDDSLSYYELLNKVVDYLNKTMHNVNILSKNVDELEHAYNQLVEWVNTFKDYAEMRLDTQDEKIAKLENDVDEFFKNTTAELKAMQQFIETTLTSQNEKIAKLESDTNVFITSTTEQINTFTENTTIQLNQFSENLQNGLDSIDGKVTNALIEYTESDNFKEKVDDSLEDYADTQPFEDKLDAIVEEKLGGTSVVEEISEINNKIGTDEEYGLTVFKYLNVLVNALVPPALPSFESHQLIGPDDKYVHEFDFHSYVNLSLNPEHEITITVSNDAYRYEPRTYTLTKGIAINTTFWVTGKTKLEIKHGSDVEDGEITKYNIVTSPFGYYRHN